MVYKKSLYIYEKYINKYILDIFNKNIYKICNR